MPSLNVLILLVFLLVPVLGVAAPVKSGESITKSDLTGIKIVSTRYDKISLFLKNNLNKTYRITNLSEKQANNILVKLGNDQVLEVQSVPVKGQNYLDVTVWK